MENKTVIFGNILVAFADDCIFSLPSKVIDTFVYMEFSVDRF